MSQNLALKSLVYMIVVVSLKIYASAITGFKEITSATQCVCPRDVLMYECVIVGPGATLWKGSVFRDCRPHSNQIVFRHATLTTETSVTTECGGGLIRAEGIKIENGREKYRSQVNVTIYRDLDNATIECIYDNVNSREVGNATIHVSGLPEHAIINLVDANSTCLTFSILSPVLPNCSHLNYSIEASNCGSCPNNTDSTTIICSNFTTSAETNICNLTVGGVLCGNLTGDKASVLADLRVPNAPVIESQPVYLQEHPDILAELNTSFNLSGNFSISTTIDGSTSYFTVIYSDSISGETCHPPIIIPASSCVNGICSHLFDVLSSSDCPASTDISTMVFASNVLGDGALSNSITSGANNFVRVSYDMETSRFNCSFLYLLSDGLKQCTANITYGTNCDRQLPGLYSNTSMGGYVTIPQIELNSDVAEFCYNVVASSGNLTATIRGRGIFISSTAEGSTNSNTAVTIIVSEIFVILAIAVLLTTSLLIIVFPYYRRIHRINKYTMKIAIMNGIDGHIETLQAFKELKININGYNTHLHHKNFKRQHEDLPDYSIYHVRCECSRDPNGDLKTVLYEELLPQVEGNLKEQLKAKIDVTHNDNNEMIIIKFPVRSDEPGSLLESLNKLKELEGITLVGINTGSIWGESEFGHHQYSENYIKFSCSRSMAKMIVNRLNMIEAVKITNVLVQVQESTACEQVFELLLENSPGTLIDVLQIFKDEELNVTRINNEPRPSCAANSGSSRLETVCVSCCCRNEQQEEIKVELQKLHAEKISINGRDSGEQTVALEREEMGEEVDNVLLQERNMPDATGQIVVKKGEIPIISEGSNRPVGQIILETPHEHTDRGEMDEQDFVEGGEIPDVSEGETTDAPEREMGEQRCTINYSVWNESGRLGDSLKAFKVLGINIDAIKFPAGDINDTDICHDNYQRLTVAFDSTNEAASILMECILNDTTGFAKKRRHVHHNEGLTDAQAPTETTV